MVIHLWSKKFEYNIVLFMINNTIHIRRFHTGYTSVDLMLDIRP